MGIRGALLLTAGYGTRVEPLSLCRPKCLLPYGGDTLLALAARRALELRPAALFANATVRPDLVAAGLAALGSWTLMREPLPLGTVGTMARLPDVLKSGTLLVSNTDMVTHPDMAGMLRVHRRTCAQWTALCGPFPEEGRYGGLPVGAEGELGGVRPEEMHYYGISLLEPPVLQMAATLGGGSVFGDLLESCLGAGLRVRAFRTEADWLDMGSLGGLRQNILAGGSWVSAGAEVSPGAELLGTVSVGAGCRVGSGARVRDSVMLAGSSIECGELARGLLPWDTPFEYGGAIHES